MLGMGAAWWSRVWEAGWTSLFQSTGQWSNSLANGQNSYGGTPSYGQDRRFQPRLISLGVAAKRLSPLHHVYMSEVAWDRYRLVHGAVMGSLCAHGLMYSRATVRPTTFASCLYGWSSSAPLRGVVLKRYRVENQKVQLVTHANTPAAHGPACYFHSNFCWLVPWYPDLWGHRAYSPSGDYCHFWHCRSAGGKGSRLRAIEARRDQAGKAPHAVAYTEAEA